MPTRLPRVNIVVTKEQHALLSELAELDPGTPSAAGFVRQLLDQVTPLLRATVPAMRAAKQETDSAREQLQGMLGELQTVIGQADLLDTAAPRRSGPQRGTSEDAPPKRRRTRRPASVNSQGQ